MYVFSFLEYGKGRFLFLDIVIDILQIMSEFMLFMLLQLKKGLVNFLVISPFQSFYIDTFIHATNSVWN